MRGLMEADLKRVATKVIPWILIAAALAFFGVSLFRGIADCPDRAYFFLNKASQGYTLISLIIGFAALFGIYADEFKSMVMIGVIGTGLSRNKFVLAKFLDLVILSLQMYFVSVIFTLIMGTAFGIRLNDVETRFLVCVIVFYFVQTVVLVSLAAIFYFLSENAAVGLFAYIAFGLFVPLMLSGLTNLTGLGRYHLNLYYIEGLVNSGCSNFVMGDTLGGIMCLLMLVGVYMTAGLLLTMLVFRKKELNF